MKQNKSINTNQKKHIIAKFNDKSIEKIQKRILLEQDSATVILQK